LSHDLKNIETEHPRLLRRIDDMLAKLAQPVHQRKFGWLRQELDELVEALRAHEMAENKLLEQGFAAYLNDEPRE
jgi:hypothetical protein